MTDAIRSATTMQAAVSGALKSAAEKTGVGFDYLYRVAMRESSLDPKARASTSSAAGLFQFIEQTWLGAVKKYGAAHGLAAEAGAIAQNDKGRFFVADPAKRQEILDLRFNPEKAAALAGELARENRAALEGALGRGVEAAELYAAHFLGAGGAKKLLTADAGASAAQLLPQAAAANRHVFFDGARARSVAEVIDSFRRTIGEAKGAVRDIGVTIEKALRPLLGEAAQQVMRPDLTRSEQTQSGRAPLERAAFSPRDHDLTLAREGFASGFEVKGLSPLALVVLQAFDMQALDPTDFAPFGPRRDKLRP